MNKKAGFALLLFTATVFNIAVTVICFGILWLLYTALLVPRIPEETISIGLPSLFAVSVILSLFIYRQALKGYLKKRSPSAAEDLL
ncbi:MAG: leader peptide processing enzyme [Treponema sp.]|nr:leader peptide processing enzyme [Treponema sp.]